MTYHYYKEHFFDNIDLQDERFLRTPYFAQKLETFIDKLVIQVPDSVVKEGVRLIEMARGNEEMFRFLVQFMFNRANESKIMGMDAAMVAFAEKYYLSGEATWADQEFLDKLETRVREIKPTLIGNKAHEMRMESIEGQIYSLNELNAEITIVAFFEPSCGHCKKEIPKLYREVFEPYRSKGVQVFAVYTLADRDEWTNFINEHELYDWINVYDPYHQTHFRDYYDIKSTPTIFILDREKKIIAKKLDVDQMPGFLDYVLSNK
jgi:thiol-disulfide isomerase/thioredoxin